MVLDSVVKRIVFAGVALVGVSADERIVGIVVGVGGFETVVRALLTGAVGRAGETTSPLETNCYLGRRPQTQ